VALHPKRTEPSATMLRKLVYLYKIELHLSESTGTVRHPNMQKIRIIGFFFEKRLHVQFELETDF